MKPPYGPETPMHRLLSEVQGALEVIHLDMGGEDPGVGQVFPLPLSHTELAHMIALLLDAPSHTDYEYNDLKAKYDELLSRIQRAAEQLNTTPLTPTTDP